MGPLAPGEIFARDFQIVRPLSEGGMGAVYVAHQLSTGRERALKLMHSDLVLDPKLRQRFEQEARIGGRIASDHVVEVIAAGVDEARGVPWLAMELLKGETLTARVERLGPRPADEIGAVFEQLCHALAAAHAENVVHRDLKPDNVFLAESRRVGAPFLVKVLDFGIAKVVLEAQTRSTAAIGTPWWMAPEQSATSAVITPAADVWALGLIAFYLFTGRSYWRSALSDEPSPVMALREIVLEPLEPASFRASALGHGAGLPAGFDAWFGRCVAREASERFRHAGELFEAFRPILAGASSSAGAAAEVAVAHAPRVASAPRGQATLPVAGLAAPVRPTNEPAGGDRRYVGPGGLANSEPTRRGADAAGAPRARPTGLILAIVGVAVVGAGTIGYWRLAGSTPSAGANGAIADASTVASAPSAASTSPATATPPLAAAPPVDEFLRQLIGRRGGNVSHSETIRGAGGVFAGLPSGWVTQDLNDRMANEPFDCLVLHVATMSGGTVCFLVRDTLPQIAGKNGLDDYGSRISWKDIQWGSWQDATVGAGAYKAQVVRGKGETIGAKGFPREGFAAFIDIPGKRKILGIGSWRNEAQRVATLGIFQGIDVAGAPATPSVPAAAACARCATQEDFDAALRAATKCCPVVGCASDGDCHGRVCCRIPNGQLCADAARCGKADRVSGR